MPIRYKLIFLLPDLRGGGAERAALGFMAALSRETFELHLVVCDKSGALRENVPADVTVHELGRNSLFALPVCVYRFRRLLDRIQPAAVISFLWLADAIQLLAHRKHERTRAVVALHMVPSMLLREPYGVLKHAMMAISYPRADGAMAVSPRILEEFRQLYPPAGGAFDWVQANPFHFAEIEEQGQITTEDWSTPPGRRLVAVGRLEQVKGFDLLIQALALLDAEPPWELVLAGEGSQRALLEQLAGTYGIAERVRFAGFRDNPYTLIKHADLLVVSSRAEAFPNVIIEAQALGTAVISVDCYSGPRLMIEDDVDGRLVAPHNPAALAAAIAALLDEPATRKRLALAARARVARFETASATADLERNLLSLIGME